MSKSRRQFLQNAAASCFGAAIPSLAQAQQTPPPGEPPAFGTAPPVGPEVSTSTFMEAEKLVQAPLRAAHRAEAAGNWRSAMAPLYERRTGPRRVAIEPAVAPYSLWNPVLPGQRPAPEREQFVWTRPDPGALPSSDADIAFAPVTRLARWIETRQISSERLTRIYLDRLRKFDPKLRCVITLTADRALEQARNADREI